MLKKLQKTNKELFFFKYGEKIIIDRNNIPEELNIRGDLSEKLSGDLSGISGDISSIYGNASGISGDL